MKFKANSFDIIPHTKGGFMKYFFECIFTAFFMAIILFGFAAMAQVAPNLDPISNMDFFSDALKQLSSAEFNAGGLVLAGVVVQIFVKFLKTPFCGSIFPAFSGFGKLCIVYVLSIISGIIVLKSQGLSWPAVLVHSQTVFAYGVLLNEVLKHYNEIKPELKL